MSELIVCFGDDPEYEDIQYPRTAEELDWMLESKINEINVDGKDWCVLAVDHDQTYRNTDKEGGGYIKFYPHCKTISKDMSDKLCYRVIIDGDEAVYTVHDGKGKGTDYMPMPDREMLVACLALDVYVDGTDKMMVIDMFNDELKNNVNHSFTLAPIDEEKEKTSNKNKKNKNKEKKQIARVSTSNIKNKVKGTKLEKFLDIKYDGKRKL